MKQPRDQYWSDLLAALEQEADQLGGFGAMTVTVRFHDSQPREVEVLGRVPKYLLGKK